MAVKHTAEVTLNDLTDAYGVTLTNEAATFKATSDTMLGTAGTATTKPQAFLGTEAIACTVDKDACVRSDTANVTVAVSNTGDNATWPLITITVGANATAGGTVTIPVVIGTGASAITIEKVFSYSLALKGATGAGGTSVTVTSTAYAYQLSTSGTTVPTGTWQTTPQAPTTTQYAWTRTTTTFSEYDLKWDNEGQAVNSDYRVDRKSEASHINGTFRYGTEDYDSIFRKYVLALDGYYYEEIDMNGNMSKETVQ